MLRRGAIAPLDTIEFTIAYSGSMPLQYLLILRFKALLNIIPSIGFNTNIEFFKGFT